jgi:hypothetical protein
MKDNLYKSLLIILACTVVLMLAYITLSFSQPIEIDCSTITKKGNGVNYEPLPEQCEKEGE